jgi:glycine C-acetyltransferase
MNRLNYIKENPGLRKKLWDVVSSLQKGLRKAGLDIGETESPVTPVYISVRNMQEAVHMMVDLRESFNIFCVHIIYPYIQQNKIMIRLIPTLLHTQEDVEYTIESLVKVTKNIKDGKYIDDKPMKADTEDDNNAE